MRREPWGKKKVLNSRLFFLFPFFFFSRLKLRALHRFTSTATAVEEITAIQDGKIGKSLKKFLSEEILEKGKGKHSLLVAESKLGTSFTPEKPTAAAVPSSFV